ncbi:hypothetical protein PUN28_019878 [Cardiocondyla obscurior]|uniref:Uncharacterized protein n=1 Tax=Cardiocondyla obscurior TaxID=286306 RepID=A0AAW2EBT5_9HYME
MVLINIRFGDEEISLEIRRRKKKKIAKRKKERNEMSNKRRLNARLERVLAHVISATSPRASRYDCIAKSRLFVPVPNQSDGGVRCPCVCCVPIVLVARGERTLMRDDERRPVRYAMRACAYACELNAVPGGQHAPPPPRNGSETEDTERENELDDGREIKGREGERGREEKTRRTRSRYTGLWRNAASFQDSAGRDFRLADAPRDSAVC